MYERLNSQQARIMRGIEQTAANVKDSRRTLLGLKDDRK
jgi:hypothetical protein